MARTLGLPIPEILFVELDRSSPAPSPTRKSGADPRQRGLNLGLDYLPGAINYDPAAMPVDAELASRIVWFDAFTSNVDRTTRNPNLMVWHRKLYLIDHGAAVLPPRLGQRDACESRSC